MVSLARLIALCFPILLVMCLPSAEGQGSCDAKERTICYPTACINATCSFNQNASCVPDRCGCEARFFLQTGGTYQEITKVCGKFNNVQKIIQFHQNHSDSSDVASQEPDSLAVPLQLNLNRGLSELLLSLANALRNPDTTLEQEPSEDLKRIYIIRQAKNALRALRRARTVLEQAGQDDEDNVEEVDDEIPQQFSTSKRGKQPAVVPLKTLRPAKVTVLQPIGTPAVKVDQNADKMPPHAKPVVVVSQETPVPEAVAVHPHETEIKKPVPPAPVSVPATDFKQLFTASSEVVQKAMNLNNQIIQEIIKQNGVFRHITEHSDDGNITADEDFFTELAKKFIAAFGSAVSNNQNATAPAAPEKESVD